MKSFFLFFVFRFRIALRHVAGEDENIIKNLENLQNNGFINYYGLQRFGNSAEIPTYKIGIALLKSDFKEVRNFFDELQINANKKS